MRWMLALLTVLMLAATACNDAATTNDVDDGADTVEVGDAPDTTGGPDRDDGGDGPDTGGPDTDDSAAGDDTADEPPSDGGQADGQARDVRTDHPVEARPGRWAVGEAGSVEWDLVDDGLTLVDVTEEEGWTSRVDEDSGDEIEVDFRRDTTAIEIEVELDDGQVEVDIDTDIEPADPAVYELGQAGSVEFAVEDGRLVLVDVVVADGWERHTDEESDDEIEFSLRSGDERWDVEIEIDDGAVELEIDYKVRTAVSR